VIRVFLPAYNEELALEPLVRKFDTELKRLGESYHILVLDDGSSDQTAAVAIELSKKYPLTLMKHPKNLGLGETMRDGLRQVAGEAADDDAVATMDCDDTHDPKFLGAALSKLDEGYDMVILSRYQKGGGERGLSPLKSFLSKGAGTFLKLFFPIEGVKEYSCGYRVMRASALKKAFLAFGNDFIKLPHMGFVVTPEILIKFRMLGLRIAEVPFVLEYGQKPGVSKNRPLKTIAGYFALVSNFWGRRVPQA
jgi:dolichol-phosphate mannosyltransferase